MVFEEEFTVSSISSSNHTVTLIPMRNLSAAPNDWSRIDSITVTFSGAVPVNLKRALIKISGGFKGLDPLARS
ncbi:MAG TPA: hypothetical protein VNM15_05230 [Candidatus Binatia bacterium]|nr:hypothetical protein [Candidatus Binatia bacterium]